MLPCSCLLILHKYHIRYFASHKFEYSRAAHSAEEQTFCIIFAVILTNERLVLRIARNAPTILQLQYFVQFLFFASVFTAKSAMCRIVYTLCRLALGVWACHSAPFRNVHENVHSVRTEWRFWRSSIQTQAVSSLPPRIMVFQTSNNSPDVPFRTWIEYSVCARGPRMRVICLWCVF